MEGYWVGTKSVAVCSRGYSAAHEPQSISADLFAEHILSKAGSVLRTTSDVQRSAATTLTFWCKAEFVSGFCKSASPVEFRCNAELVFSFLGSVSSLREMSLTTQCYYMDGYRICKVSSEFGCRALKTFGGAYMASFDFAILFPPIFTRSLLELVFFNLLP